MTAVSGTTTARGWLQWSLEHLALPVFAVVGVAGIFFERPLREADQVAMAALGLTGVVALAAIAVGVGALRRRAEQLTQIHNRLLEHVPVTTFASAVGVRTDEDRNRLIVETANEGIWMVDAHALTTFANRVLGQMLGLAPEALLGRSVLEFVAPERRHEAVQALEQGRSGTAGIWEFELVAVDGRRIPVLISSVPVFDSGQFNGGLAMVTDLTELKLAEKAQLELAAIVESSSDAILLTDTSGTIRSWNRGAERTYGYSPEEILGRSFLVLVPPERRKEAAELASRIERGEHVTGHERDHVRKDGTRIDISISLSPLRDSSGAVIGVSSIARDITEQKRLERQLHHARKMEAVGQLAGGVAHDFNNSLMAIRGFTELLLERLRPDDPRRRHAEGIRKAAEGATSVTRQLLAFSRKQLLQPQVVDLNESVHELDPVLRQLVGDGVELVLDPRAELGQVRADPGQIEQVILNLAVNARDAMSAGGGTLTIETELAAVDRELDGSRLELPAGRYVRLTVTDTGEGMTPEVRARVFEPFYSTKELGRGTGLGLSTVYGIVKQTGGAVHVRSEPGRGSRFDVYLPQAEGEPSITDTTPAAARGGDETILLVEDEDTVRALLGELLRGRGYTVVAATGGEHALELLASDPRVDALLTDVVMPDMRGPELARRAKALRPGIRVVYMSGHATDAELGEGAWKEEILLEKPFSADELARTLRSVLDAGAPAPIENQVLV